MRWLVLLVVLLLAGASSARAQSVTRPFDFAVGFVCPGGALPIACDNPRRLTATDPLPWERCDYGNMDDPYGCFQAVFATMCGSDPHSGCAILNWDFSHEYHSGPTFTQETASFGYGGEVYRGGDQGHLRIVETRDGGTPYDQIFCGPTGWIAYAADAPTGSWAEAVAHLQISSSPSSCPSPLNAAYTRWRFENLSVWVTVNGVGQFTIIPSVISQHFGGPSISDSTDAEEAIYGWRIGRYFWASDTRGAGVNLSSRVPYFPYPAPDGFNRRDARLNTKFIPPRNSSTQAFTLSTFGWPPAGSTP